MSPYRYTAGCEATFAIDPVGSNSSAQPRASFRRRSVTLPDNPTLSRCLDLPPPPEIVTKSCADLVSADESLSILGRSG